MTAYENIESDENSKIYSGAIVDSIIGQMMTIRIANSAKLVVSFLFDALRFNDLLIENDWSFYSSILSYAMLSFRSTGLCKGN